MRREREMKTEEVPVKMIGLALAILIGCNAVCVAEAMKAKQTDKPAIVFMVAGQSNAGGCGVLSPELHKQLGRDKKRPLVPGSTAKEVGLSTDPADYTHSYIWVPDIGFERIDPARNCRPIKLDKPKMHGMELPVVAELEERFPENDIYVIKHGPSGKNLYHDWNPERDDGFYANWIKYYSKGMAQLSDEYPEVRAVGLYWDQGESDKRKADQYRDNLANFIETFRRDSGMPDLKFFIRKHIYDFANIETLVEAQEEVVEEDPNCYLLDIDLGDPGENYKAWSYSRGNIHLSSKAFVALKDQLFNDVLGDVTVESFDLYQTK